MISDNINSAGLDRRALPEAAGEAEKNGGPPDNCRQEMAAEDVNYQPVPPRTVVTVSVRYRVRVRGRPLPYPLDEGAGE